MKYRSLTIFSVVILFITLLPCTSFGQDSRNWLAVKGGFYSPTGDLHSDAAYKFKEGYYGEAAVGRYLDSELAVQLEVGYFKSKGDVNSNKSPLGAFVSNDEISVVPVILSVMGIIPGNNMEAFGEVGIGVFQAGLESKVSSANLGNFVLDDKSTVFGVSFGGGGNYNLTNHLFVGIEGKYILTADATFETNVSGTTIKSEVNLNGFLVTASLGFRF